MTTDIRDLKLAGLEIWRRNLAESENIAANYGLAVPIAIQSEIRAAKQAIARIQDELDRGAADTEEEVQTDILALVIYGARKSEEHSIMLARIDKSVDFLLSRQRPSPRSTALKIAAGILTLILYTIVANDGLRSSVFASPLIGAGIIGLGVVLVGTLYYLGVSIEGHYGTITPVS